MSEIFAKMAGTLDSNRKIRKAGRDGRDVFLWVLRQVALRDSDGQIPIEDLTDYDYLADQLMCSKEEAERGVNAAIGAALLSVTGSVASIVGWGEDWGRRPMSNAERQARYREKTKRVNAIGVQRAKSVTEASLQVTDGVTSNVEEEIRVEEREGRVTPLPLALVSPEPRPPDRVARLWAEQERLRAEASPGCRSLSLTKDRRKLVQNAIRAGYSDEELLANLQAYATEAARSSSLEWFNGETNWRPANIARTLGKIDGGTPARRRELVY